MKGRGGQPFAQQRVTPHRTLGGPLHAGDVVALWRMGFGCHLWHTCLALFYALQGLCKGLVCQGGCPTSGLCMVAAPFKSAAASGLPICALWELKGGRKVCPANVERRFQAEQTRQFFLTPEQARDTASPPNKISKPSYRKGIASNFLCLHSWLLCKTAHPYV